jgi:iron complex outermembrane receptor protein
MLMFTTVLAALVVLMPAAPAAAQSVGQTAAVQLKRLSLEELGQVVVTSVTKEPERVRGTAAAIYVITQDDIRRSGATTLPDVLRLAPGLIVSQSDSNRWAVGIRGLADIFSKDVLVMIDGRSAYTPLVGGVHWAIQDVVLADVEQIEVIRGPGGSLWGANAVNGVINVITKGAADTQGVRVGATAGSVEHGRVSVRYGGTIGNRAHYRLYAKGLDRGAQFHPDGTSFDAWRSGQAGFRTDWKRGDAGSVTFSGDIYKTRTGERAQVSYYTPPSVSDVDGTLDLTGGNLLVRWERRTRAGSRTRFQAYYDHTDRGGFTFRERRDTVDADFNMRLGPMMKRHELAWGLGTRISPSTVTQVVPTLNFLPNSRTNTLASAFVQDDISLVRDRLSLSAGTKLEHNNYTGLELLPSARLLWTAGRRHSVWTSITRSVRTPSRFERDLSFQVLLDPKTPVYLGITGSPDFDAETVLGAEAGYRSALSKNLYLDFALFDNRYHGLAGLGAPVTSLETLPISHVLVTFPFANGVEAKTRGFEIAPDWKPVPFWQLKGSYSYLHLTADNLPGFSNTSLRDNYRGQSPAHQARLQSRLDLPGRFELDHTYRFVSRLVSQHVPAYHSLDVRFGWHASDSLELLVTGQNLLHPHHPEFNAVPVEIRRSAYAGVAWTR